MTFPLDIRTELNINGTWVDISGDVRTSEDITITGGRRDESSAASPGTCTFRLNNRDGRYSNRNPHSIYYGQLGRNTPVRVSVPGTESYLDVPTGDGQCSTPASPDIAITGDLDVRVDATGDWYRWAPKGVSQSLIGQLPTADTGQWSWALMIGVAGDLRMYWSENGSEVWYVNCPVPAGLERAVFRGTIQVDNGLGGSRATLYTGETINGPWTELAVYDTDTPVPIYTDSTADLQLPVTDLPEALHGQIHQAEVYNDGELIAAPDFRSLTPGAESFTDSAGVDWTVTGDARITDRAYRFTGEVSAWPQRWDVSGNDAWVPIQAAGVLRRMGQGTKALQSTLRRRIPSADPAPVAYWPMEDGNSATQAYSPLDGVTPMATTALDWAAGDGLPSSMPLPEIKDGSAVSARFKTVRTDGWHIEMVYKANDTMPSALTELWRIGLSGSTNQSAFRLLVGNNSIRLETLDHDGALYGGYTTTDANVLAAYGNGWTRMQIYAGRDDTGAAYWAVGCMDITTNKIWYTYFVDYVNTYPGSATSLRGNWGSGFSGFSFGHVGVFAVPGKTDRLPGVTVYDGADSAFTGETTIARMRRLSVEEDLPLHIVGDPAQTERVGPQRVDTILNLVQSAADVDGGLLHEQRDSLILAYRARHTLYNQTPALTLDYAANEVPPPLEPVEDDQSTRNDVTVTRDGGSSARVVQETGPLSVQDPPVGVGRYDTEVTLNAAYDSQLLNLAGWQVHLGTHDGPRFPQVSAWLHANPNLVPDVLALNTLDRMQIINTPKWLPPGAVDLLVEGYEETLNLYSWEISYNTSPADLWTVGVTDDDVLGRADTDGSVLTADADADATSILVKATDGPDWVTDPAEFPFDIRVGGEVMTVSACTESSTVANAAADSTETAATTATAPSVEATGRDDLLIGAWVSWGETEAYAPPSGMSTYSDTAGVWSDMTDAVQEISTAGPTGDKTATRTASSPWAALSVLVAGPRTFVTHHSNYKTDTAQTHNPGPVTITTGADTGEGWWLVALHAYDNASDTSNAGPTGPGWELLASAGNTALEPFIGAWVKRAVGGLEDIVFPAGDADDNHARLFVFSNLADLSAQTMTVTRSVNGITKGQTAGTDVRLAQPTIVAL